MKGNCTLVSETRPNLFIFNFEFNLQLHIFQFSKHNTILLFCHQPFPGAGSLWSIAHRIFFGHFGFSSNNLKLAMVHDMK